MEPQRTQKWKYSIKKCPVQLTAEQKRLYRRLLERYDTAKFDAGSAKLTRRLASLCTHPFLVPNAEQDYFEKIIASAQDPAIMKNKARDRPIMYSSSPARRRIRIKTPMERYDPSIIPQRSSSLQIAYPSDIPSLPEDVLIAIFGLFGTPDLVSSMAIVCTAWKKAAQSDLLWRPFCERLKLQRAPNDSFYTLFARQFDGLLLSFSSKFEGLSQILSAAKSKPQRQQHLLFGTADTLMLLEEFFDDVGLTEDERIVLEPKSAETFRSDCDAFSAKRSWIGLMKISSIETILKKKNTKEDFMSSLRRSSAENATPLRVIFVETGYTRFEHYAELLLQCFNDGDAGAANVSFELLFAQHTIEETLLEKIALKKPHLFYQKPIEPPPASMSFRDVQQLLRMGAYSAFQESATAPPPSSKTAFAKASFSASPSLPEVDINDPNFWIKILPKTKDDDDDDDQ